MIKLIRKECFDAVLWLPRIHVNQSLYGRVMDAKQLNWAKLIGKTLFA